MISFEKTEPSIIFSEEAWKEASRSQKIRVLKSFEREIANDLGMSSKPKLVLSKTLKAAGRYSLDKHVLNLSESLAVRGIQLIAGNFGAPRPNSNIYILFAMCHELEHAAQHQRVAGKIEWNSGDDKDGIMVNLQQKSLDGKIPYIKGMADGAKYLDLYYLQPAEYGANQSAICELKLLQNKYQNLCNKEDVSKNKTIIREIANDVDTQKDLEKHYHSSDIVHDLSHCLQNLFAGKQYPVPPALMQDVRNACEASYRYIQSDQYKQMEALLKREIKHELAKQECER